MASSQTNKTYTCTEFKGHWPTGTAAVVRATSPAQASDKLNAHLVAIGLAGGTTADDMQRFPSKATGDVLVLCDGNY